VVDAFGRAQETVIEVARSTAEMIERAGAAAGDASPDGAGMP
jgi:hypothetical protein